MNDDRKPEHPVARLFVSRWSPRAFDASVISEADVRIILEAGRWAPSAYNTQPWRFLFSLRGDAYWSDYQSVLDAFNQQWAKNASALVFLVSDTVSPGDGQRADTPSRYNSFDAGAAWMQMALQTSSLGYAAHAMAGLDFEAARQKLRIPERFKLEIAIAIGRQSGASSLSEDLKEREKPSGRMPLNKIAFKGPFPDLIQPFAAE